MERSDSKSSLVTRRTWEPGLPSRIIRPGSSAQSKRQLEWIEDFYNPIRRHSALDYLTPNEYEAVHSTKTQAAFS